MVQKTKAKHKHYPHVLPDNLDTPEIRLLLDKMSGRKLNDKSFYAYLLGHTNEDREEVKKSMFCLHKPRFRQHYTRPS